MVVVTPAGTEPGSIEWLKSTAKLAKSWSDRSERDVRQLVGYLKDLRGHQWEKLIGGKRDWGKLCREIIGHDEAFIAELEDGAAILDRRGHKGPITEDEARAAIAEQAKRAEKEPLGKHGGDRKSREPRQVANSHLKPSNQQSSTSADRLAKRIARDRPDILDQMKAGKYKSVRAAAKAAGIIKDKTPLMTLIAAWKKASDAERHQFKLWLETWEEDHAEAGAA